MKVVIVGTGYVGLVAGACFAESGHNVVCVDVDEAKLQRLRQGDVPFFEPGLDDLVRRNWPERLDFSTNLADSLNGAQVAFIAVGTPPQEDGSADLSAVLGVAKAIAQAARHELVVVLKSTVPVGTNERVTQVVTQHSTHKIMVASNPEFLKEGDAINDFLKPDRIVVGARDERAFELLTRLYSPFNRQRNRLHKMDPKSAEIVKYASNAMLATKISFMNEIAMLCDAAGGDVERVRIAVGADRRIGYEFLYPGLGFGGSCFPKDLRALVRTGADHGLQMDVSSAAVKANTKPPIMLLSHMLKDLGSFAGKHVAIWGLAFKPRTDDVREAPAFALIEQLVGQGATVAATDPEALDTARQRLKHMGIVNGVALTADPYAACEGADALVLCTEWRQFNAPNVKRLSESMRGRLVYDGRNVWTPAEFHEAGFKYLGIGRS
ncbi:MAG TPA: UDP-glucose/GDP-mannose dehydrogenase family protein [Polyangiaceae bacterium]|jgi:UDPglucose 6-dehydrogenase|nr:UDP-glucose/GDP-mannose dehydrogenase family protein [Polyangiaceae bacterium]